ncbi:MAG: hypothetical protein ACPGGK_04475 [Pikeienuella sp.]
MTRIELTMAFAALVFVAMLLGWLAHWLWARAVRASSPVEDRVAELAAELMVVEANRDSVLEAKNAEITTLIAEAAAREQALAADLREREAELAAAMDGLAAARRGD